MGMQVDELIGKIRAEGIAAAEAEAAGILEEARRKAAGIVADAERDAKAVADRGVADARRAEEAGKAALSQASRDTLLLLRDRIQASLDALVARDVSSAMDDASLKALLPGLLKAWKDSGSDELEIVAGADASKTLDARFISELKAELGKGVTLVPHQNLKAGFRIVGKPDGIQYDFSAEALAAIMSAHVNATLAGILAGAAKG